MGEGHKKAQTWAGEGVGAQVKAAGKAWGKPPTTTNQTKQGKAVRGIRQRQRHQAAKAKASVSGQKGTRGTRHKRHNKGRQRHGKAQARHKWGTKATAKVKVGNKVTRGQGGKGARAKGTRQGRYKREERERER